MSIERNLPEISALRREVESRSGIRPLVHNDFENLRDAIAATSRDRISETTLERIWGYSTRKYDNISLKIVDILCQYIGHEGWEAFCLHLRESGGIESDMFDEETIESSQLKAGDRLRIGWPLNRVCIVRYEGNNLYEAERAENAKIEKGDRFECLRFQLNRPLYMENLTTADGRLKGRRYGVGLKHGLTMLQKI